MIITKDGSKFEKSIFNGLDDGQFVVSRKWPLYREYSFSNRDLPTRNRHSLF